MIKVTDNKEIKETVLAGLKRNKEKYGKKYCPCSLVRDENTVCMCKEFREMEGNLTKGSILKTLMKLAIPIMASSFLGTLYNITDMAWIGLLGAKAVAGVGVGGMFT